MVNEYISIITLLLTFAKTSITSIKLAGPSDDATQTSAQSLPRGVRAKRERITMIELLSLPTSHFAYSGLCHFAEITKP